MKKISLFLIIILIFTNSIVLSQGEDLSSEIHKKLNNITEEEKEILKYLFIQVQEIEEMERENKRIDEEIHIILKDIDNIDNRIKEEEKNYEKNLEALKGVLQSYQKMGPGSYIEIILSSDSLTSLIRRINILRDLTKNTDKLLATIENSKENLVVEKNNLDEKVKILEEKQKNLEENLYKKQELVREQEAYLASLQSDKELYLERLEYISMMMEEIKEALREFTNGFTRILKEGNFPDYGVKQSITLRGIKGTIEERVFNDIINSYEWMPKLEIKFNKNEIELNAPDKGLSLAGNFEIQGGQIIKFVPEKGSFFHMPLEKGTLESLFEGGDFILNFEPLIGNNILKSVEIMDGYMEVLVAIKLF